MNTAVNEEGAWERKIWSTVMKFSMDNRRDN